jgi:hypothetical protein
MAEFEEVVNLKTKTTGTESVKSLKQEIREAQAEAVKISRQFGDFSKEATTAAKRVAVLRDEMGDFQQRVAALNPDRFQAIAGITQGIAGGITAATGAMALFGGESEDVQKVLVKVQGAIAFSQGIQQILDLKNSFGAVATVIKTQVVTAFSTLRGAIIATGIGALVVGIGLVIAKLQSMSSAAEEAATKTKAALEAIEEFVQVDDLAITKRIARLKGLENTQEDIFKLEQQRIQNRIDAIQVLVKNEERSKEEIDNLYIESSKLRGQLEINALNFEADARNKRRAEEKKQADERKAAYERALAEQKEYHDKVLEEQKQFQEKVTGIEDAFYDAEVANRKRAIEEQEKTANDFIKNEESRRRGEKARKDYYAKKDKERADEAIATEKALMAAKQMAYDATSQLLGNLSQLFAQGSAEQKAFAVAQVLVDEAKAIAATIAGATQAAAAGGPAAPFLVGAYIASGLATVAANFKRVKDILNTPAQTSQVTGTPQFNPINSSSLPGSDEVAGRMQDMRVYVLEGDITKTQGKQQRNRNVSVI